MGLSSAITFLSYFFGRVITQCWTCGQHRAHISIELQRRIQAGERNENASITEELTESQVESVAITLNAIDTGTPAPDSVGDELRVSTRT
jgi:hypothetical protein